VKRLFLGMWYRLSWTVGLSPNQRKKVRCVVAITSQLLASVLGRARTFKALLQNQTITNGLSDPDFGAGQFFSRRGVPSQVDRLSRSAGLRGMGLSGARDRASVNATCSYDVHPFEGKGETDCPSESATSSGNERDSASDT
jgi:hypothetical protein